MSAPALVGVGRPTLRIRGTPYPVLLPTFRDPRLHLAAVIVSLQVLGQVAFDFRLSIAQILVALVTSALIEVGVAFWRQRVVMWPASALLTGNGVAFILRVPGTEHGDWWSMRGAWIFAGTAAVAIGSKYVIRFRGRHIFNPSNFGLVLCFLVLGSRRADPLDFWWGPMSLWLALALAIIVAGGLAILLRLHLLGLAIGFWVAFVAGIGVLAASGHAMTARWHLGPVTDGNFWLVLAFSPEVLVFLFFMITDPRTVPAGHDARLGFGVAVGLLATLLIAPQTTEFGSKVALLAALALVSAARPLVALAGSRAGRFTDAVRPATRLGLGGQTHIAVGAVALAGGVAFAGLLVVAGIPARTAEAASAPVRDASGLPAVTVAPSSGVASQIDRRTAQQIARDVVADLRAEADALRRRDRDRAAAGADGAWLAQLWRQIRSARGAHVVPAYHVERVRLSLEPGDGQAPPTVVATLHGTVQRITYAASPTTVQQSTDPARFERTVELAFGQGRYRIVGSRGGAVVAPVTPAGPTTPPSRTSASGGDRDTSACQSTPLIAPMGQTSGVAACDVAQRVGLRFNGSYGSTIDVGVPAMSIGVSRRMQLNNGNGAAVGDYNGDGALDVYLLGQRGKGNRLFRNDPVKQVPHSVLPESRDGAPRSIPGARHFTDVTASAGVGDRGMGRAAQFADLNGDGSLDLVVVNDYIPGSNMSRSRVYRNSGDGTFVDVTTGSGFNPVGMIVGGMSLVDYNGDGLLDVYVSYWVLHVPTRIFGYGSARPAFQGQNRLYQNLGGFRFKDVTAKARLEHTSNSFTPVFADFDRDTDPDLFLARDTGGPDLYYENVGGRFFRDIGIQIGAAHRGSDMGVAVGDANADGLLDLYITNITDPKRKIGYAPHNALLINDPKGKRVRFREQGQVLKVNDTGWGWGAVFVDVNLDGYLDIYAVQGMRAVVCPSSPSLCNARAALFLNDGRGSFKRMDKSGFDASGDQRALIAFDYNRDGSPDLLITQVDGKTQLLENRSKVGHWLTVVPKPEAGLTVPGTVVSVTANGRTTTQVILAGGSYLAGPPGEVYFGLRTARRAEKVEVIWPDGGTTTLRDVDANQVLVVERGSRRAAGR